MKIALLDLNHKTLGVHTNTVPYGIGCIATYAKKNIKGLDIRLFKYFDKLEQALKDWMPDLVGITQYCWNSQLNLFAAQKIKEIKAKCKIIAGGPNLYDNFLRDYPFIDYCVKHDGEIAFIEIIKKIQNNDPLKDIKEDRLESLDVFGAMYCDGVFDDLLNEGCNPFIQTHRGCPYSCAFCCMSDKYYSKMIFLSPEIFRKEMEYLGKRFNGRHNVTLYLGNTNMGTFEQDFEIARIIKDIQDKYDFPRLIDTDTGKDPKKLLKMMDIVAIKPTLALQTTTEEVLKNINRNNIPLSEYIKFQRKAMKIIKQTSITEMIMSLPGETKETFLTGLKKVMNSGVQNIVVYTLMKLNGTPLASDEFRRKYGYNIKHRIVPRQFSVIDGKKIFDTEEVIVGTKDMPFKDYLELRGLCFTISVFFNSTELIPLKRFLIENNIHLSEWVFNINNNLKYCMEIYSEYTSFIKETEGELFDSRQKLIDYYDDEKYFQDLIDGKRGDNLLRKYKCNVLSKYYDKILEVALREASKLLNSDVLIDLRKYIEPTNIKSILNGEIKRENITLNYDIPSWFDNKGLKKGKFVYRLEYPQNRFDDLSKMNQNKDLSLQILYRDGGIIYLFPKWIKVTNRLLAK